MVNRIAAFLAPRSGGLGAFASFGEASVENPGGLPRVAVAVAIGLNSQQESYQSVRVRPSGGSDVPQREQDWCPPVIRPSQPRRRVETMNCTGLVASITAISLQKNKRLP